MKNNIYLGLLLILLQLSLISKSQPHENFEGEILVLPFFQDFDSFTDQTFDFSPDNKFFICGTKDGCVVLYNIKKNDIEKHYCPHSKRAVSIACSPDNIITSGAKNGFLYSRPEK